MATKMDTAVVSRSGMVHTYCCAAACKLTCRHGYAAKEISQEAAAEGLANGRFNPCKACAKLAAKDATPEPVEEQTAETPEPVDVVVDREGTDAGTALVYCAQDARLDGRLGTQGRQVFIETYGTADCEPVTVYASSASAAVRKLARVLNVTLGTVRTES